MLADDVPENTKDVEKPGSGARMLLRLAWRAVILLAHEYVMSACTALSFSIRGEFTRSEINNAIKAR